jgi:hypothetical protein
MPGARVHDPQKITATFAGRPLSHGRDEGDFLSTEYEVEQVTKHVGGDGSVTFSLNPNRSGKCTINCMSTSDTHRLLTALHARQGTFGIEFGVFELVDLNNGIVERSAQACIAKAPANAYGPAVGKRAWELQLAVLERTVEAAV